MQYEVNRMQFTEELLKRTQATLLKDYGMEVSLDETNEILDNLARYITVLHDIESRLSEGE